MQPGNRLLPEFVLSSFTTERLKDHPGVAFAVGEVAALFRLATGSALHGHGAFAKASPTHDCRDQQF